jgi:hypothetical protein
VAKLLLFGNALARKKTVLFEASASGTSLERKSWFTVERRHQGLVFFPKSRRACKA